MSSKIKPSSTMKFIAMSNIILLVVVSISANDVVNNQLNYADSLFNAENYYQAITEYKRLQFFDDQNKYAFETNYKIGISYKKGGFYENAIRYLSKAQLGTENIEKKIQVDFQIVRTNILRRTFDRSLQLLEKMETEIRDSSNQVEINYWRGWTYILWDKWDEAAVCFSRISPDHELKLLCEQVHDDKYSVTFARVISYILPGAGQFYTGNYFSGFMSLAWNALWGYLTVNAFVDNRAFDGAAIGSLLWLRFYRGNIQNAEKLAHSENLEISNQALLYLMDNYKGKKP